MPLVAQECTGSKGNNIFEDGNFGSGEPNILQYNPQIAPGYVYAFNPPPDDGRYVITNSTAWPNAFQTWLQISDKGPEFNGYMMVVNASYEPGLFYEKEVFNVCENTLYEFSADIINMNKSSVANTIYPNVEFLINGEVVLETGNVPQDEKWHNYSSTLVSGVGETSFTLSLRNKAPGGFGNDLGIDNIVFTPCGPNTKIYPNLNQFCEDTPVELRAENTNSPYDEDFIQWQVRDDSGIWMNVEGDGSNLTYPIVVESSLSYRYIVANSEANLFNENCHVISNTRTIYVVRPDTLLEDVLICEGDMYELPNGELIDEVGTYTTFFTSASGGCENLGIVNLDYYPVDECNNCLSGDNENLVDCYDCNGVPFGPALFDSCGNCLSVLDPEFADNCERVSVPSAFTPNGDDINDYLEINIFNLDYFAMSIYDRWGNKVFHTKDYNTQWDGTANGKPVETGVYVYYVEFKGTERKNRQSTMGNITLLR